MSSRRSILISVSGLDRPGITAALMDLLSFHDCFIEDVEQIVIRGRLNLSTIVSLPANTDLRPALLLFGYEQDIDMHFEEVSSTPAGQQSDLLVTMLGTQVTPEEFGSVATIVASHGGNIERIVRLAREPVRAYELAVSGPNPAEIRVALLEHAHRLSADLAVHRRGLGRRAKRLVVLDVDSTLIQDEAIDMLAEQAGVRTEVAELTERAMAGELNFNEAMDARLALLAGADESLFEQVVARIELTPGANTFLRTLQRLGYKIAIVSGGFTFVTDYLANEYELDHAYANRLEVVDGKLTGRLLGPMVDRERKAELLREIAAKEEIPIGQVVAVGDGANDLDMLAAAGLGIAFNAKQVVREAADTTLNVPYLDAVLFVLGITRHEVEEAEHI